MIDKVKTLKYLNISDSIHAICLGVCLIFFPAEFVYLLGFWGLVFLYSGLAIRRYCKGKGMMRFGVSSDIDNNDKNEVVSSYKNHVFTIVTSNILMVGITIYYLCQGVM